MLHFLLGAWSQWKNMKMKNHTLQLACPNCPIPPYAYLFVFVLLSEHPEHGLLNQSSRGREMELPIYAWTYRLLIRMFLKV
jgi:hypothetical protein